MLYFDVEADWQKFRNLQKEIAALKASLLDISLDDKQLEASEKQLEKLQSELTEMAKAAAVAGLDYERGFLNKISATKAVLQENSDAMERSRSKIEEYSRALAELERRRGATTNISEQKKYDSLIADHVAMLQDEKDKLADLTYQRKEALKSLSAMSLEYELARNNAREFADTLDSEGVRVERAFGNMKRMAAGLFSLGAAKGFVQQMAQVRASFQDTESTMGIFLKDQQRAVQFVDDLKKEAYFNMFEFSELNQASTQMLSYGTSVDEVIPKLHQLSEIATGTHQPIGLMVDLFNKAKAVGTVDTRGLQQWARAGLNVADVLENAGMKVDRTKITFEQLNKAIEISTAAGGQFNGIMNSQMQNINAIVGQLKDNITNMFNDLGQKNEGTIHDAIQYVSELVSNYESIIPVVKNLVIVFGSFKAAMAVGDIIQEVSGKFQDLSDVLTDNATKTEILAVKQQGLKEGTEEYVKALETEMAKTKIRADQALKNADKELQIANQLYDAKAEAMKQIDDEIAKTGSLLKIAEDTGDAKQAEVLQTKLTTLETQKNTVSEELNKAAKEKNSKAIKQKEAEQQKEAVATRTNTLANAKNTASQKFLANAVGRVRLAFNKLKIAMLSNPFTLIAAAVAGLVAVTSKLIEKNKEIHAGEERAKEAMGKAAEAANDEKIKLNDLTHALDDVEEGTEKYNRRKQDLVNFAKQYDSAIAREIEQTGISADNYERLAEAIEKANYARKSAEFVSSESKTMKENRDKFFEEWQSGFGNYIGEKGIRPEEMNKRGEEVRQSIDALKKFYTAAVSYGENYAALSTKNDGNLYRIALEMEELSEEDALNVKKAVDFLNKSKTGKNNGGKSTSDFYDQIITEISSRKGMKVTMAAGGTNYADLAKLVVDTTRAQILKENYDEQGNLKGSQIQTYNKKIKEIAGVENVQKLTDIQNQISADEDLLKLKIEQIQQYADLATTDAEKNSITVYLNELNGQLDNYKTAYKSATERISEINNETVAQALVRTKAEWQKAERELEKIKKEGGTVESFKNAQAEVERAKKAYQSLGGVTDEKELERQQKFADDLEKQRMANRKRELALEEDSIKKKLEVIDLEYKEKLSEYDKQERELTKKRKNGEITADEESAGLQQIEQQRALSEQERDKQIEDTKQAYIDSYLEYDKRRREIDEKYEQDKAALQDIINDKNATAEQKAAAKNASVKLEEQHNKQQIDLGLEQLKNDGDWQMVFQNLNNYGVTTLTNLKKKLDEIGKGLTENMNPADLQAYNEALQNLQLRLMDFNPKQSFENAKAEMEEKKEMLRRAQIYAQIAKGTNEEAEANKKLANAENDLAESTERYNNAAQKYADHVTKMIEPLRTLGNQMKEVGNSSDTMAGEIVATIGTVIDASMQMIDTITEAATKSADAVQKTADVASETAETTKKGAEVASQAISAVEKASVILAIISAVLQVAQAIDQMLDKRKNEAAEKQKEIARMQEAVNDYRMAVLEAQQAEKGWFNASGMQNLDKQYEKGQQALKNYYDTANRMEEKYQEEQGGGFMKKAGNFGTKLGSLVGDTVGEGLRKVGMDAVADVFEYADLTQLTTKAYQAANGEEWGSGHDTMYNLGKGKADMVRARDNLRIQTQAAKKGFLGIGAKDEKTEDLETWLKNNGFEGSLFGEDGMIDIEAADAVLSQFGDKLVGNTKETIEQLKESKQQYDEWLESLKEYTNSMFGGLTDNLVDSLFNWLDTGEDVMDSFEKTAKETFRNVAKDMIKTLSNKMIFDGFADKIQGIYKESQENGWSTEQLAAAVADAGSELKADVQNALPVLQTVTKQVSEAMGDLSAATGDEQSAVAGAFQTMSEEKAGVLEGRFTAVYESNLAIQGILNGIGSNVTKLTNVAVGNYQIVNDMRNIIINSNLHLQTIAENSVKIEKLCTTISADLYDVSQNTKKL